MILGEVGLSGETRSVSQCLLRVNEAEKLGFKRCILPKNNHKSFKNYKGNIELIPVANLKEGLDIALTGGKVPGPI